MDGWVDEWMGGWPDSGLFDHDSLWRCRGYLRCLFLKKINKMISRDCTHYVRLFVRRM